MSLYLKHRPDTFAALAGAKNVATVGQLRTILAKDDPPHAYLLYGPSGCGKTTIGRILARELGAVGEDYDEKDSADFRGIDTIRELRRLSYSRPLRGKRRVWLLDECHKLTNDAQNALLKGLEDPPPHAYYVLCTTEPEKLLNTIRGRCVAFQVHGLEEKEMVRLLNSVSLREGASVERDVLRAVADKADGHVRDALQILEKVLAVPPEEQAGLVDEVATLKSSAQRLARTLLGRSGWRAISDELTKIALQEWREDEAVKEKARDKPKALEDYDLEQIRRGVLGYCGKVLLGDEDARAAAILDEFRAPFFESGMAGLILACYAATRD